MTVTDPRRLAGSRFGLSISAAANTPGSGNREQAVNQLTFRLATTILLEGGSLLLGHRWRPDGIMEHLAFQAQECRWADYEKTTNNATEQPVQILNLIAWPDQAPVEDAKAAKMIENRVLEIRQIKPPGIPDKLLEQEAATQHKSDFRQFARTRALTEMRQEMAKLADLRICLGGSSGKDNRRLPGVIEEALLTHKAHKPLYISSALGGASKAMSDAILQRRMSDEARSMFFTPQAATEQYHRYSALYPSAEYEGPSSETGWNAFDYFKNIRIETLSQNAGLTENEYIQVLTATDVQRVLGIAMSGFLSKQHAPKPVVMA